MASSDSPTRANCCVRAHTIYPVRRPDERGGQGGPAPRGPGVWGAREESKNTVGDPGFYQWGIQDFDKGGGGGPPKKNVGLATLGMIVTTLYLHTHKHISGE